MALLIVAIVSCRGTFRNRDNISDRVISTYLNHKGGVVPIDKIGWLRWTFLTQVILNLIQYSSHGRRTLDLMAHNKQPAK